jgi:two-component system LytT family response regulator
VIRVLIVDDERPAREGLRLRLAGRGDVEVVAEAASGAAALQAIEKHTPDLVFLDVRMPGMNGFELLQRVPAERRPRVVFVTAYDRYAIRAFEMNAIDYLLKPIVPRRLDEALERARKVQNHRLVADTLASLARELDRPAKAQSPETNEAERAGEVLERISVRDRNGYRVLPVERIRWIQAVGNYVALHTEGRELLHRATLQEFERSLPSQRFARIHRSVIVNLSEVATLRPVSHGDFRVVLKDGTELRMSRKYRSALLS